MSGKVECSKICVDCVVNDPVDVRCGGPNYLGFDFAVKEEQVLEMQDVITSSLELFSIPLIDMYVEGKVSVDEKNVWTKDRIVEEIKGLAPYLQSQAERNYKVVSKR